MAHSQQSKRYIFRDDPVSNNEVSCAYSGRRHALESWRFRTELGKGKIFENEIPREIQS